MINFDSQSKNVLIKSHNEKPTSPGSLSLVRAVLSPCVGDTVKLYRPFFCVHFGNLIMNADWPARCERLDTICPCLSCLPGFITRVPLPSVHLLSDFAAKRVPHSAKIGLREWETKSDVSSLPWIASISQRFSFTRRVKRSPLPATFKGKGRKAHSVLSRLCSPPPSDGLWKTFPPHGAEEWCGDKKGT